MTQAEETERRSHIADYDTSDPSQDLVRLRRMTLSIQSVPRSLDLHAAVGPAAQRAVSVVGQEALSDVSIHSLLFAKNRLVINVQGFNFRCWSNSSQ